MKDKSKKDRDKRQADYEVLAQAMNLRGNETKELLDLFGAVSKTWQNAMVCLPSGAPGRDACGSLYGTLANLVKAVLLGTVSTYKTCEEQCAAIDAAFKKAKARFATMTDPPPPAPQEFDCECVGTFRANRTIQTAVSPVTVLQDVKVALASCPHCHGTGRKETQEEFNCGCARTRDRFIGGVDYDKWDYLGNDLFAWKKCSKCLGCGRVLGEAERLRVSVYQEDVRYLDENGWVRDFALENDRDAPNQFHVSKQHSHGVTIDRYDSTLHGARGQAEQYDKDHKASPKETQEEADLRYLRGHGWKVEHQLGAWWAECTTPDYLGLQYRESTLERLRRKVESLIAPQPFSNLDAAMTWFGSFPTRQEHRRADLGVRLYVQVEYPGHKDWVDSEYQSTFILAANTLHNLLESIQNGCIP
jgi:hypothetical protein